VVRCFSIVALCVAASTYRTLRVQTVAGLANRLHDEHIRLARTECAEFFVGDVPTGRSWNSLFCLMFGLKACNAIGHVEGFQQHGGSFLGALSVAPLVNYRESSNWTLR